MNYSISPSQCRVDLFKPSGKWYMTFVLDLEDAYNEPLMHDGFMKAIEKQWPIYKE